MPRITKKQLQEEQEKTLRLQKNTIAAVGLLMQKLELEIDRFGYIQRVDEELSECSLLAIDGKRCKSTLLPNVVIDTDSEIAFDPYNNTKLMSSLFVYYIQDYLHSDIMVMGPTNKKNNTEGIAIVKLMNGQVLESNVYYRDSLKYMDIIYQLEGSAPPEFRALKELDIK